MELIQNKIKLSCMMFFVFFDKVRDEVWENLNQCQYTLMTQLQSNQLMRSYVAQKIQLNCLSKVYLFFVLF